MLMQELAIQVQCPQHFCVVIGFCICLVGIVLGITARPTSPNLAAALPRARRPRPGARSKHLLFIFRSFLLLYERVRDFFASVDGRDDD